MALESIERAEPVEQTTLLAGFHALGDPIRLGAIEQLRRGELCVCDLCELLAVSQSKLSFHLKVLREAGLIEVRQDGRWNYYRLNSAGFERLECYLSSLASLSATGDRACCP